MTIILIGEENKMLVVGSKEKTPPEPTTSGYDKNYGNSYGKR